MQNPLQIRVEKEEENNNLSPEAKQLLEILDELQDFTAKLRKKLLTELRPEKNQNENN